MANHLPYFPTHYIRLDNQIMSFRRHDDYNVQIRQFNLSSKGEWIEDTVFLHKIYVNGFHSIDDARNQYRDYIRQGWQLTEERPEPKEKIKLDYTHKHIMKSINASMEKFILDKKHNTKKIEKDFNYALEE
jgi:hypothetical protein